MKRVPVTSSNLRSVGYDTKAKELEVEFKTSGVYLFSGVHSNTHRALLGAPSKGKAFWRLVRDKYPFQKTGRG